MRHSAAYSMHVINVETSEISRIGYFRRGPQVEGFEALRRNYFSTEQQTKCLADFKDHLEDDMPRTFSYSKENSETRCRFYSAKHCIVVLSEVDYTGRGRYGYRAKDPPNGYIIQARFPHRWRHRIFTLLYDYGFSRLVDEIDEKPISADYNTVCQGLP